MERRTPPKRKTLDKYALMESLSIGGYISISKRLLKKYGPETAVFLGYLIEKYLYIKDKNKLVNGDLFFVTHEQITEEIGLTLHKIRGCKAMLKEENFLETVLQGAPPKEYYRLNVEHIMETLFFTQESAPIIKDRETASLKIEKPHQYNSISINTNTLLNNKKVTLFPGAGNEEEDLFFKGKITPSMFDKFWGIYPRKGNKGPSQVAWDKLCKDKKAPRWRTIERAIKEQKETPRWQNPKYIPLASTWLNNRHWLNDPAEMTAWDDKDVKKSDYEEDEGPITPIWRIK